MPVQLYRQLRHVFQPRASRRRTSALSTVSTLPALSACMRVSCHWNAIIAKSTRLQLALTEARFGVVASLWRKVTGASQLIQLKKGEDTLRGCRYASGKANPTLFLGPPVPALLWCLPLLAVLACISSVLRMEDKLDRGISHYKACPVAKGGAYRWSKLFQFCQVDVAEHIIVLGWSEQSVERAVWCQACLADLLTPKGYVRCGLLCAFPADIPSVQYGTCLADAQGDLYVSFSLLGVERCLSLRGIILALTRIANTIEGTHAHIGLRTSLQVYDWLSGNKVFVVSFSMVHSAFPYVSGSA